MNFTFNFFIIWFAFCTFGLTNEIKVFEFTEVELSELEVRKVRGLMPHTVVAKITKLLGKKVQLTVVTEEHKAQALQLTEQFQICHNGDNKILSLCKARDFILVTFDKMLLKASQFVGIAVFSPFTAGGI